MAKIDMRSPIGDFFGRIGDGSAAFDYLSGLISTNPPTAETEWLDFKGNMAIDDPNLKRIWSKALSGFANTHGGLLIFGIDARKDPATGIDAAHALSLVPNPAALRSRLMELHHQATDLPVLGVEIKAVPGQSGDGFVVCLVPNSPFKPHRSEHCNKQYYIRAGNNFDEAGPGLLRTLFYPRYQPRLWVEVTLCYQLEPADLAQSHRENPSNWSYSRLINPPSFSSMRLKVRINNDGTATARDIYVVVQTDEELIYHAGEDWDLRKNPQGQAALAARRSLHLGEVSELFEASSQRRLSNTNSAEADGLGVVPYFDHMRLRFLMYAENAERQAATVLFTKEDISYENPTVIRKCIAEDA